MIIRLRREKWDCYKMENGLTNRAQQEQLDIRLELSRQILWDLCPLYNPGLTPLLQSHERRSSAPQWPSRDNYQRNATRWSDC